MNEVYATTTTPTTLTGHDTAGNFLSFFSPLFLFFHTVRSLDLGRTSDTPFLRPYFFTLFSFFIVFFSHCFSRSISTAEPAMQYEAFSEAWCFFFFSLLFSFVDGLVEWSCEHQGEGTFNSEILCDVDVGFL